MSHVKPDPQPTYLVGEVSYTCDESKIGFPNYIQGGLFQLFRKIPFGWENRGKVKREHKEDYSSIKCCVVCNSILRVGKEQEQLFRYCPICLIKTYIHKYDPKEISRNNSFRNW